MRAVALVAARSAVVHTGRPPDVLIDEPASALDPIATQPIEELIDQLTGYCASL